ncbi:hypothetical protein Ciccas_006480 [Cichlidogyrus casuarinus]|uniref:BRCT domain-containing protein n=1 Tax=Cichlidogyrus casuarinus TaxID=1844966 RepID=A0ABD2Q5N9_9PLAT
MKQISHESRLSSSMNSAVFGDYKRPNYFIIHPNWLSESISIQKMGLEPRPPPIPTSKSLQNLVGKPPCHPNYRKQKSVFQKTTWPIDCRCNGTQPVYMSRPPTATKRLTPRPSVERSKSVPSQQDNKRPETAPYVSLEKKQESLMSNNSNEEQKDEAKVSESDWQDKSNVEEAEEGTF